MKAICLLLFLALFTSCDYIANLDKTGQQDTIPVSLEPFNAINLQAPCRVELTNGLSSDETRLHGIDFIIDGYQLTVENGTLTIGHQQSSILQKEKIGTLTLPASLIQNITLNAPGIICSPSPITVTQLHIVVNGSGIYSETDLKLNCNTFQLAVYGGINQSMHHLEGTVKQANYYLEGCTGLDASKLITQETNITHRSNANCYLHCQAQLNAVIYSTGSVYYSGSPQVSIDVRETTLMKASGVVTRSN
ncbi:putative autotransporter adhesin-like protein [Breznakibacter xylanolyticus]|uniref:Putative autotransporter adhesin-like protein n=1 Tax=Breznakibacter xylanolyticus TaxID=990 RepID=A0A2W7NLH5_9BACT|nr:DUF2807 domain-containing protein [Breznakibacter xylanolyticus]PZX20363.1 putative autotransporter adhesin-like protein [Breznakibacter xylanolyticus]